MNSTPTILSCYDRIDLAFGSTRVNNSGDAEPKGFLLCPRPFLVDGSYFIKRYRRVSHPSNFYEPRAVLKDVFNWCLKHLEHKDSGHRELYRIFFYD